MPAVFCQSVAKARDTLASGGGPVVVVPIYNAFEDAARCLKALDEQTDDDLDADVLIIDDASTEFQLEQLIELVQETKHRFAILLHDTNLGFVRSANEGFSAAGHRDVVLLNSDVVVGPEWLARLREAAYSDSRIATVTPLSNNGTILSVPYRNQPTELSPGQSPEGLARAVAAAAMRFRPRIPTCVGYCAYIKRMAIDLVGNLDETLSPGYGEEIDFSQRCSAIGLAHVCADDVFVYHRGGASFGQSVSVTKRREANEEIVDRRYPGYQPWTRQTAFSPTSSLTLAVTTARRALLGMSVVIDATCLGPGPTIMGTQRYVVETIRALSRRSEISRLVVLLPPSPPAYLDEAFSGCERLEFVCEGQSPNPTGADVAYRPFQISTLYALRRLHSLAERVAVCHLDFISYGNPTYFPTPEDWLAYRAVTKHTLATMDGIAFLSQHSENDGRLEALIPPGTVTKVVYAGTDHEPLSSRPVRPVLMSSEVQEAGFVLCLGADYRHKNRPFVLRVFAEMCNQGYTGRLVLAGPRVPHGSSRPEEEAFLEANPAIARRVDLLAEVSEAVKRWLFRNAALVINPSLYEGFGFTPFEAAAAGVPCLSSAQTSLSELLPAEAEFIAEWNPEAVATQALALIGDGRRRQALVESLQSRGNHFTWDRVADGLIGVFAEICERPRNSRQSLAIDGTNSTYQPSSEEMDCLNQQIDTMGHELSLIRKQWWFAAFSPGWRGWLSRLGFRRD